MAISKITLTTLYPNTYTSQNPTVQVSVDFTYTAPQFWPVGATINLYSALTGGTLIKELGSITYLDPSENNSTVIMTFNLSGVSNGTYYAGAVSYPDTKYSARIAVTVSIQVPITISFDVNGGSPGIPPSSINTYAGSSATMPSNSSQKTGYTFAGWNTNAAGTGTTYNVGSSYVFNSSITLYAKWVPITYGITYNLNGGSGNHGNPTIYNITTPTITFVQGSLTRYGYDFVGWDPISVPQGSTGTKNTTAQWTPKVMYINLDPNGGEPLGTEDVPGLYGALYFDSYVDEYVPVRSGYTFAGWFTQSSGGTQITESTTIQNENTHTIYAQWIPIDYSISYTLNWGSVSGNPTQYNAESATFTLNNPTRTGHSFIGWTGTGLAGLTMTVTVPTGTIGDRSYVANWEAHEYIIRFNPNGGAQAAYDQTFTYNQAELLEPNAFTRSNYTFVGWNTAANGSGDIYDENEILINMTSVDGGVVNFYAMWDPDTMTVTFNSNGGTAVTSKSGDYGTTIIKPTDPTKTAYTFAGWYRDALLTDAVVWPYTLVGNETFYAGWTPVVYSITYFVGSGSHSGNPTTFTIEDLPITLNAPTLTDYTGKWIDYYYGSDMPSITTIGNKILSASYTPVVYSITYVLNGGSHSGNPSTFTVEGLPITLNAPTKTGYVGSWNVSQITTTGNKTITASYTAIEYTLTYSVGDGGHSGNPATFTIEDLPITLNAPTRLGYVGVWKSGGVTVTQITNIGNQSLTAEYTAIVYSIAYVLGSGSHSGNPTTFTIEDLPIALSDPIRTGYVGVWNLDPITTIGNKTITASYTVINYSITYVLGDGSHTGNPTTYNVETPTITLNNPTRTGYQGSWNPGNSIPLGSTGNKTFTATYVANTYTIKFNKNSADATGTMNDVTATYDVNVTLPNEAFTRPQYQFVGWATSAGGAVAYVDQATVKNLTSVQNGTITLYAKWRSVNIKLGADTPSKLMWESSEVLKVYYEGNVVWDKNQSN